MALDDYLDLGGTTRVRVTPPDATRPPTDDSDRFPKVIYDQREIYGRPFQSADEVFEFWADFLANRKAPAQSLFRDEQARHLTPWISGGKWVDICPECNGGIPLWDRNPYGACLDCGRVFEVDWQAPEERSEISRLLSVRPARYRHMTKGETAVELTAQNDTLARLGEIDKRLYVPERVDGTDDLLDRIDQGAV